MIHPQVMFLGDPAAATPYVGLAKKLARQTFKARIRNKTYKVGDATIRVENLLPPNGSKGGSSKAWIEAGQPPAVLVMSAGVTEYSPGMWRNDNTRIRLNLFLKIKKPFDQIAVNPAGEPYGPYRVEHWKSLGEISALQVSCDSFIPNILNVCGKKFRVIGYKSNSTETLLYDEYYHCEVRNGENGLYLQYLYKTPYWDGSLSSVVYWLFATDRAYLYETVSTQSNNQPWCWFSVRSAKTGEMLLEKQDLGTTNMYGIAALDGYVFLSGAVLTGEETTRLSVYKIAKENEEVTATLVWGKTLAWDQWYIDAVAINNECVYVLVSGFTINDPSKITTFSKLTGEVVGELTLPDLPDLGTVGEGGWADLSGGQPPIGDSEGGSYFYEGIATNKTHLIAVADTHWFFYYKRTPVFTSGILTSETYELDYSLIVTWPLPSALGEYDPSAVIAR